MYDIGIMTDHSVHWSGVRFMVQGLRLVVYKRCKTSTVDFPLIISSLRTRFIYAI